MISFSIDKQSGKVNVERMSRPVDSIKNKTKDQPLVLVLTSAEQSPTFASRLKRKLLSGPITGGAYTLIITLQPTSGSPPLSITIPFKVEVSCPRVVKVNKVQKIVAVINLLVCLMLIAANVGYDQWREFEALHCPTKPNVI